MLSYTFGSVLDDLGILKNSDLVAIVWISLGLQWLKSGKNLQNRNWFNEERNVNITCCGEHIFVWVASPSLTQLYKKQKVNSTKYK